MQTKTTTRRAVLAGIATAPALAAPALALTSAGPDPIFALIERHKASNAAFGNVLTGMSKYEEATRFEERSELDEWWQDRENETSDAERCACEEMVATVPATFAGLLALLRYIDQEEAEFLGESDLKELLSTTVSALAAFGVVS